MFTRKKIALGSMLALGTIFVIGNSIADTEPPPLDHHRLIYFMVDAAVNVTEKPKGKSLSYIATTGGSKSYATALSYAVAPDYFADYVCEIDDNGDGVKNDCHVTNYWNDAAAVLGYPDEGYALQLERLNMTHGAVIYDMAAWQIAVALYGAKENKPNYITIADKQTQYMINGAFSNEPNGFPGQNRAVTGGEGVDKAPCSSSNIPCYNGFIIKDPSEAYTFRMVPTSWQLKDPFALMDNNKVLNKYVETTVTDWPKGDVTWQDWKGITGENAWAHLIGPLQTDYLRYIQQNPNAPLSEVKFQDATLKNAVGVLHAIGLLQAEIGGLYYAPKGTLGNSGAVTNPYEVAIENNASMMAGLLMLEQALDVTLKQRSDAQYEAGLTLTREILYGRERASVPYKKTAGLLPFFMNTAWDKSKNRFYTHGYANDPSRSQEWYVDPATINAVDANSWTIATLGPKFLDTYLDNGNAGAGTTYKIWTELQKWGVYRANGTIMGVGFDDSGLAEGKKQEIMSAEWTFGAIGMLRAMTMYDEYQDHHAELQGVITDMKEGLKHLSTDYYPDSAVFAKDVPQTKTQKYDQLVIPGMNKTTSQGMVYASKRYFIPFGWWANAVPSTASTAWAVMEHYPYNPFSFGGHYDGVTVDPYGAHFKSPEEKSAPSAASPNEASTAPSSAAPSTAPLAP